MQDASNAPLVEGGRSCPYCGGEYWGLNCHHCFEDRDLELAAEFAKVEVEGDGPLCRPRS